MDIGERVVSFDNLDGDGGDGYGRQRHVVVGRYVEHAVPRRSRRSIRFAGEAAVGAPGSHYQAQTSGRLAEITDSVFFKNEHGTAYTEANARDVFNVANTTTSSSRVTTTRRGRSRASTAVRRRPSVC
jgi:hypothetical protein